MNIKKLHPYILDCLFDKFLRYKLYGLERAQKD